MARKVLKDGTVITLPTVVCAKCRQHTPLVDAVEGDDDGALYCQDCSK